MSGELVPCPTCGAGNASDAPWCTQCYGPMTVPEPEPEPEPTPPPPPAPTTSGSVPPPPPPSPPGIAVPPPTDPDALLPLPGTPPPPPADGAGAAGGAGGEVRELRSGGGRFRETPEGLEWTCATCQEWNPIERVTCRVCSAPFGRDVGPAAPEVPDVAPALLVLASIALPGAGHGLLRLWGQAVTRGILGALWGFGALLLFVRAAESGQPMTPVFPLAFGWAVLAAASANDAVVAASGQGETVLYGRRFAWLVAAVVVGVMGAAVTGAMSAMGA